MPAKECYHCRQRIEEQDRKSHDCWTTTEENLTRDLDEDLMDAWLRIREEATSFGEQRIYASHKSIMFARKHCYCFVRPKKKVLELCFFLTRAQKSPQIKSTQRTSRVKVGHLMWIKHRDEVEGPVVDWLREAYAVEDQLKLAPAKPKKKKAKKKAKPRKKPRKKSRKR